MPLASDTLAQLRAFLQPLHTRVANMVARAVVSLVDDSAGVQSVQLGVLADENIDDAERVQEYGFSSHPIPGAEAVAVFPGGDRGHAVVIAVDDRRHRVTGLAEGEVAVYAASGAMVTLRANGDIDVAAAPGGKVYVNDGSGGEPLITKSQFDAHTHPTGTGPSGPPSNASTSGTTVLEAK